MLQRYWLFRRKLCHLLFSTSIAIIIGHFSSNWPSSSSQTVISLQCNHSLGWSCVPPLKHLHDRAIIRALCMVNKISLKRLTKMCSHYFVFILVIYRKSAKLYSVFSSPLFIILSLSVSLSLSLCEIHLIFLMHK